MAKKTTTTGGGGGKREENFLKQFRVDNADSFERFTATQFLDIWLHYDKDGNGYIEGSEIDNFLKEFITSVNWSDEAGISDSSMTSIRDAFMEAFDENKDDKIEIGELAEILPTEQNFLLLFRNNNPLDSSVEFMKIWKEFDTDCSGYIEADELKSFLKSLIRQTKMDVTDEKLIEYTSAILQIFDRNKDGKLQLSEMAKLIKVKENYLCRPIFRGKTLITHKDIEHVFRLYDKDHSGTIEKEELNGLLKDLMDLVQEDYDESDIDYMRMVVMEGWDLDRDGRINMAELTMLMQQQQQYMSKCSP